MLQWDAEFALGTKKENQSETLEILSQVPDNEKTRAFKFWLVGMHLTKLLGRPIADDPFIWRKRFSMH